MPILPVWFSRARNFRLYCAGREGEAGVVLQVAAGELRGAVFVELDRDAVAHAGGQAPVRVAHLADEIELGGFAAALARQLDVGAGDLHRDGHEVAVARQAEVVHLERQREVGDRVAQHEGFLKLVLLVGGGELPELLGGEVAAAVIELRLRARGRSSP